ncbi:glycosyltransferase [bacterium]|nr:glycosyltransferase [bacterium]
MNAAFIYYGLMSLFYGIFALWLWVGLHRLRRQHRTAEQPRVVVIIPARNEAKDLGRCLDALQRQSYPTDRYEILVVDDDSSDDTAAVAQAHGVRCVLSKSLPPGWSPKKAALHLGIQLSRAEIILTTDADCVAPARWIETMISYFTEKVGAVVSWVDIEANGALLSRLEALDAWSFQVVGAAAIGHQRPFLANGANWGYRRALYEQAGGFCGIEAAASGDDDLLLQKMRRRKQRVAFADAPDCRVRTIPCGSLSAFLQQRLRWASKTALYPFSIIVLEGFIYLYNASLLLLGILVFSRPAWLFFFLVKIICDTSLLYRIGTPPGRKNLGDFLLAQWWQVLYTLLVGSLAWRGRFVWKGRRYTRGELDGKKEFEKSGWFDIFNHTQQ